MRNKFFALVIAFVFICPLTFAQNNNEEEKGIEAEVYAGYGTPSLIPVVASVLSAIGGALTGADEVEGDMTGVVHAGVNFYPFSWLGLGGYASYEGFKMTFDDKPASMINIITLQARVTLQYGFERVKFYHGANGGAAFVNGPENYKPSQMFGFTPIGIKFRPGDNIQFYIETGLISNAFFSAGVSYKFN
ncbi:MAG: hypothetical protein KBT11_06880 [Treponema sp.]|nr:hypothetical protein [Candidatus Treponema equifaecale]